MGFDKHPIKIAEIIDEKMDWQKHSYAPKTFLKLECGCLINYEDDGILIPNCKDDDKNCKKKYAIKKQFNRESVSRIWPNLGARFTRKKKV